MEEQLPSIVLKSQNLEINEQPSSCIESSQAKQFQSSQSYEMFGYTSNVNHKSISPRVLNRAAYQHSVQRFKAMTNRSQLNIKIKSDRYQKQNTESSEDITKLSLNLQKLQERKDDLLKGQAVTSLRYLRELS